MRKRKTIPDTPESSKAKEEETEQDSDLAQASSDVTQAKESPVKVAETQNLQ